MAVSITKSPANVARGSDVWGRRRVHLFDVTFDSSYPTGGEALGLSALGVSDVTKAKVFVTQTAPLTAGYDFAYDAANDKLVAFWGNNDGVADSAFVEVADTTDLSAVSVTLLVIES